MKPIPTATLLRCFFRTYMVGGAYNPRGLQNIGFIYALDPGLQAIHKKGPELKAARLRYARHHNSHPFWAPLLAGVFLHMEERISQGLIPPEALTSLKDTTANALSAIGDSVFNGSMLATWALGSACLVLAGLPWVALGIALILFAVLHGLRLASFWAGLTKGLAALGTLRRYDLINCGDLLKAGNAVILAIFLRLALPEASPPALAAAAVFLLALAWVAGKMRFPRAVIVFLLAAGVYIFYPHGHDVLRHLY